MILNFQDENIRLQCDELYNMSMELIETLKDQGDYEKVVLLYERCLMYRPGDSDATVGLFWAKKRMSELRQN